MKYKTIIYIITVFLNIYIANGIDFNKIMKLNKPLETKLLVMVICFSFSYLITNFIVDFMSLTKLY